MEGGEGRSGGSRTVDEFRERENRGIRREGGGKEGLDDHAVGDRKFSRQGLNFPQGGGEATGGTVRPPRGRRQKLR